MANVWGHLDLSDSFCRRGGGEARWEELGQHGLEATSTVDSLCWGTGRSELAHNCTSVEDVCSHQGASQGRQGACPHTRPHLDTCSGAKDALTTCLHRSAHTCTYTCTHTSTLIHAEEQWKLSDPWYRPLLPDGGRGRISTHSFAWPARGEQRKHVVMSAGAGMEEDAWRWLRGGLAVWCMAPSSGSLPRYSICHMGLFTTGRWHGFSCF